MPNRSFIFLREKVAQKVVTINATTFVQNYFSISGDAYTESENFQNY